MKCVDQGAQSEQAFMESMWLRANNCCGPLILIPMSPQVFEQLFTILASGKVSDVLKEAVVTGGVEYCAGHWYDMYGLVQGLAKAHAANEEWVSLAEYIPERVAELAGWDYKEMSNRIGSLYRAKTGVYKELGI